MQKGSFNENAALYQNQVKMVLNSNTL